MSLVLGVDTSNYTTSAALYETESRSVFSQRKLLTVREGEKGLRQSEAVYQHVRRLPELLEGLLCPARRPISAVGASSQPRSAPDSFMPCFEAGVSAARAIAAVSGIPYREFSHQAGHIAAALFSIGRLDWLGRRFVAFHVSGGTTEAVLCTPENGICPKMERIARSLDLKAGQAIDRVGLMLGLPFPAGPALEALARQSARRFSPRPCMKGSDCCLSGVENQCAQMHQAGQAPADIARFCLDSVCAALEGMLLAVRGRWPGIPLVFAGGVISDTIIREYFEAKYGALFARPEYSADNACGIAVLTGLSLSGQALPRSAAAAE